MFAKLQPLGLLLKYIPCIIMYTSNDAQRTNDHNFMKRGLNLGNT